ncbi:MAG TPA: hypothetical protein VGX78_00390 [Pirellulales bacterium]|nr:hypothetical protein [Pirellulales bacterium]
MRKWIKKVLSVPWRMASPLRRPMARRLDAYLAEQLQREMRPLVRAVSEQNVQLRDLNLCAESTIRELVRLQIQLEEGQVAAGFTGQVAQDWPAIAAETASGDSSHAA